MKIFVYTNNNSLYVEIFNDVDKAKYLSVCRFFVDKVCRLY